ncbi:MAG: DUF1810 domain-containing protein [Pseudomonadota bacterium]
MTPDRAQDFLSAQDRVWDNVLRELTAGQKTSHWMWFVFPQLASLGRSHNAQFYGIANLTEAEHYLRHPILGPRLREVTRLVADHAGKPARDILGDVDAIKLRSSMTLIEACNEDVEPFSRLLETFFDGERCPLTAAVLSGN